MGTDSASGQQSGPAGFQFDQARLCVTQADEAVARKDVAAAVGLYRKAMADYTRLSRVHPDWEPGMTRFQINHCKEQLRNLMSGKAVAPAPPQAAAAPADSDAAAVRAQASRLMAANRPDEARSLLIDALKSHPDDAGIRMLLGIARCQEGDYVDAMYILESVTTDDPRSDSACVALAGAYFGLGQFDDARAQLSRALALNPRSAAAHYNLARVLLVVDAPEPVAAGAAYRQSLEFGGAPDPLLENQISAAVTKAESGGWHRFVPFLRKRSGGSSDEAAPEAEAPTTLPAEAPAPE
jgi:tetratricopeptide (TPR) repeat protein